MRIAAILLTHNDCARAADLVAYVERVRTAFSGAEFFAVLADAGSTDGTAEAVEALRKDRSWLHVLHGKDRDFGAAFSTGAKLAMQSLSADFLLDTDPGLRFQVEDISAVLTSIGANDLVIGSRFAGTASSQPVCMLTQAGNFFARHILQCHEKKDMSGGLRVMRVKGMLEHFNFASIESSTCAYKFHLVSFLARSGARIAEVPMRFEAQESGACQSRFFSATREVFHLRWRETFGLPGWDRIKQNPSGANAKADICTITTSFPRFAGDDASIFVRRMVDAITAAGGAEVVIVPRVGDEPEYEESKLLQIYRIRTTLLQRNSEGFGAGLLPNLRRHPISGTFGLPILTLRLAQAAASCARKSTVLHANWIIAGAAAWVAALRTGSSYVVTLRGSDAMLLGVPGVRFVYRWILGRAKAVTAVGESLATLLREKIPTIGSKLSVIENGVEFTPATDQEQRAVLQSYGIGEAPYVVSVGSVIPRKRTETLVEIIAGMPEEILLVVCGKLEDRAYETRLRNYIAEKNIAARVKFLGAVPPSAIGPILRGARVFLTGASFEGRPNALLEAFACGCPAIASDIPAHRELIVPGENGFLFASTGIPEVRKCLGELLSNDALRQKFAAAGRRGVEGFTWRRTAEKYLELFSRSAMS